MKTGCLVPILSREASKTVKHKSILWYYNCLEMRDKQKQALNTQLKEMLERCTVTNEDVLEIEEILLKLDLERPAQGLPHGEN